MNLFALLKEANDVLREQLLKLRNLEILSARKLPAVKRLKQKIVKFSLVKKTLVYSNFGYFEMFFLYSL